MLKAASTTGLEAEIGVSRLYVKSGAKPVVDALFSE